MHILTSILDHPVERNRSPLLPPPHHVQRRADGEARAAPARHHDDPVKEERVRELAVGSLDAGLELPAGVLLGVLPQVAREAVVAGHHELVLGVPHKREGVHLEGADAGDPEEAVRPTGELLGRLAELDAGAAVGQRRDRHVVVEGIIGHAEEAPGSIDGPHGADDAGDDGDLMGHLGLVQAHEDDDDDEEEQVHDVEQLVPEVTHNDGRACEEEEAEAGYVAENLFVDAELFEVVHLAEEGRVGAGVDDDERRGHVAGDFVEDIETFVRPGREYREGCILQREEDDEGYVGDGHPFWGILFSLKLI